MEGVYALFVMHMHAPKVELGCMNLSLHVYIQILPTVAILLDQPCMLVSKPCTLCNAAIDSS